VESPGRRLIQFIATIGVDKVLGAHAAEPSDGFVRPGRARWRAPPLARVVCT
jgi:hypothetical protein